MKASSLRQKEMESFIKKEKDELKLEWDKLKKKIQEEHEERIKFQKMKEEEMKDIERKKKEIDIIAQTVKSTNLSIQKERLELEQERSKFNLSKDDLENSRNGIGKQLKQHKENLKSIEKKLDTFADKVESEVKKSEPYQSPIDKNKNVLDDISPINDNESSISGKKIINQNLLKFAQSDEVEVPLDFEETKRTFKEVTEFETINIDDEQIEKLVAEETALYDPSCYFDDQIYDFEKNKSNYRVFQVIRAENQNIGYVVAGAEIIFENNKPSINLS